MGYGVDRLGSTCAKVEIMCASFPLTIAAIYQIVTGKIPFEDINTEVAIIIHTIRGKLPAIRKDGQLAHVLLLCGLMSDCWITEPIKRIDATMFQRKANALVGALLVESHIWWILRQLYSSLP